MDDEQKITTCENCEASSAWVEDPARGEITCSACGMVATDLLWVDGANLERRNFADSSGPNHERTVRAPRDQVYFSTLHSGSSFTAGSRKRGRPTTAALHRHLDAATATLADDHLQAYFGELRDLGRVLDLEGRILDAAKNLVFRYERAGGKRKVSVRAVALCAIHFACVQLQVGRTIRDLCDGVSTPDHLVPEDEVWRARKKFLKHLPGIDAPVRPDNVIATYCTTLGLAYEVTRTACTIRDRCQEHVDGRPPSTIAAGCIMLACEAHGTGTPCSDVAAVASVAESTVTTFCRKVRREVVDIDKNC